MTEKKKSCKKDLEFFIDVEYPYRSGNELIGRAHEFLKELRCDSVIDKTTIEETIRKHREWLRDEEENGMFY